MQKLILLDHRHMRYCDHRKKRLAMAIAEIVGDSIDRAVNIEMRFRAGLPLGVTYPLYEAARKKQKKPLTWLAAKLPKDSVKAGDHVFVITGAGTLPGLPAGETDGPPGAAAIELAQHAGGRQVDGSGGPRRGR
jgi:hypothetical protein